MTENHIPAPAHIDPLLHQFLLDEKNYRRLYTKFDHTESLSLSAEPVSIVQTHCACVYLGADFVVKIKRSVAYSYINLSTLQQRKKICQRELEINQPSLPAIYLGIGTIVKNSDSTLSMTFEFDSLNNAESVLEWFVVMRRFDEREILSNVVKRNEFDENLAHMTGRSIAQYHNKLRSIKCNDGDVRISEIILELEFELKLMDKLFPTDEVTSLVEEMFRRFRSITHLLIQRSEAGFVKRCHGDLHLRNVLVHDNHPVPFDALEFDERLATTDVLYDLAFLIMDLNHQGLQSEANTVFNEYLVHTDERNVAGAALMDLFISIRAAIKAMTTGQNVYAELCSSSKSLEDETVCEATAYFELAREAIRPKKAIVVVIGGYSGSGKSTIAREMPTRICTIPGAILIQSDVERKHEFGVGRTDTLASEHYNAEHDQQVYDRMFRKVRLAITNRYPVIVDATFLDAEQRTQIEQLALSADVDFHGFWLSTSVEILKERILHRHDDPSDADVSVLEKQLRHKQETINWRHIDTTGPVAESVDRIVDRTVGSQSASPHNQSSVYASS